jgi:histidine triad (HIT) family protein
MSENCIFCSIVKRETPAHIIWEDDEFMAFLDAFPHSRGHTLVIPKAHYSDVTDLPKEHYGRMLGAVVDMCRRIERMTDSFHVGANQGRLADQVIFHVHFHIIPRYPNDNGFPTRRKKLEDKDAKVLLDILTPDKP